MNPYRSPLPEATPQAKRRLSPRTLELLHALAALAFVTTWGLTRDLFGCLANDRFRDGEWIITTAFVALYLVIFVGRYLFAQRLAVWRAARIERLADKWLASSDGRETR